MPGAVGLRGGVGPQGPKGDGFPGPGGLRGKLFLVSFNQCIVIAIGQLMTTKWHIYRTKENIQASIGTRTQDLLPTRQTSVSVFSECAVFKLFV